MSEPQQMPSPTTPAHCADCLGSGGCILGIPAAFRVPKARCAVTGLSRTYIYEVTSSKKENNFDPPVISYELKQPGAKTGVRIVNGRSFCQHVRKHQIRPGRPAKKVRRANTQKKVTAANSKIVAPLVGTVPVADQTNPPPPPPPVDDVDSRKEVGS
jgi:hypothetical protein